jgi:hypothetical protein
VRSQQAPKNAIWLRTSPRVPRFQDGPRCGLRGAAHHLHAVSCQEKPVHRSQDATAALGGDDTPLSAPVPHVVMALDAARARRLRGTLALLVVDKLRFEVRIKVLGHLCLEIEPLAGHGTMVVSHERVEYRCWRNLEV